MATYDRNLGVWTARDGTSGFHSRQEAEEYESSGQRDLGNNDTDAFSSVWDQVGGMAPITAEELNATAAARAEREERARLASIPYGTPASAGGTANQFEVTTRAPSELFAGSGTQTTAYLIDQATGQRAGPTSTVNTLPSGARDYGGSATGGTFQPTGTNTPGYQGARVGGAGGPSFGPDGEPVYEGPSAADVQGNVGEDGVQRASDRMTLTDLFEQTRFESDQQSQQSRAVQTEALAKQRELYALLTSFDPEAEAQRNAELAKKNALALSRSVTGGAESQQAGLFAALEQMPAISAEAQRAADAEGLRRLNSAAGVVEQFGSLATGTRQQDVGENQLKSQFGLQIAQGISDITGLSWELDARESALLAEVSLALDQADIQWAQLTLDEQIAEVNRVLAERGLTQQWAQFQQSQEIGPRDLYGGMLTLVGEGIAGGFKLAAK